MNTQYTGRKIAELRKEKGWPQKDVAKKLHVSVLLLETVLFNMCSVLIHRDK